MAERKIEPSLLRSPPKGFSVLELAPGSWVIHHRRMGMGCMNLFLAVWLAGWTLATVMMTLSAILGPGSIRGAPENVQGWLIAIFWLADILVGAFAVYVVFAEDTFVLDRDALVIRKTLFRWERLCVVERSLIRKLVQVKDGGEDDDSFPSWGLKINSESGQGLIFRQPYEQSEWLGTVLSQWAGADYVGGQK